jgi:hypothetical protein
MATEHVADMTVQELRTLVEAIVDERIRSCTRPYKQQSDRPVREVLASMRRNLWTPPPGSKSSLELLREDRER